MKKIVHTKANCIRYGYPKRGVFWGKRTKSEILAKVPAGYVKARITAVNEVTRWYADGTAVVRFHFTDLLHVHPNGAFSIDNGGWMTVSTMDHLTNALRRHGINCRVDFNRRFSTMNLTRVGKRGGLKRGAFKKRGGFDEKGRPFTPGKIRMINGGKYRIGGFGEKIMAGTELVRWWG